MGGFGSGGHNAKGHGTVEGCRYLDANKLNRCGAFHASTIHKIVGNDLHH